MSVKWSDIKCIISPGLCIAEEGVKAGKKAFKAPVKRQEGLDLSLDDLFFLITPTLHTVMDMIKKAPSAARSICAVKK